MSGSWYGASDKRLAELRENKALIDRTVHFVVDHEYPEALCGRGVPKHYVKRNPLGFTGCKECGAALDRGAVPGHRLDRTS